MHILMFLESEFPHDVRVENEAIALMQSGFQVTLMVPTFEKRAVQEIYQGIQIFRFYISRKQFFMLRATAERFSVYHRMWMNRIHKMIDLTSIDVIHIHDLPLAKTGLMIHQRHHIPFVLDLHENFPALLVDSGNTKGLLKSFFFNMKRWKYYEIEAVCKAAHVIVVVDEAAHRIRSLGIDTRNITIVSNTPALEDFSPIPHRSHDNRFMLTYIGGFGPHRGIETVIRGFSILVKQYPQIRLRLIGAGRDSRYYSHLIHQLRLEEQVEIIGWVPFHEVSKFIAESDACLVPHEATEHTHSTIPHKLFQYMAMEKPVIVSDCRPLKRIVQETGCGVVFQAGNPESLAEQVLSLTGKSSSARSMGKNGRNAVIKKYNWSKDSSVLINLYRQLKKTYDSSL